MSPANWASAGVRLAIPACVTLAPATIRDAQPIQRVRLPASRRSGASNTDVPRKSSAVSAVMPRSRVATATAFSSLRTLSVWDPQTVSAHTGGARSATLRALRTVELQRCDCIQERVIHTRELGKGVKVASQGYNVSQT